MGALEGLGPYVAAGCLLAAALIVWMAVIQAGRSDDALEYERSYKIAMVYQVKARVPAASYTLERYRAQADDRWPKLEQLFSDLEVDLEPPASGPEVEMRWLVVATDLEHAERCARRRLDRIGLEPLAVAASSYRRAA